MKANILRLSKHNISSASDFLERLKKTYRENAKGYCLSRYYDVKETRCTYIELNMVYYYKESNEVRVIYHGFNTPLEEEIIPFEEFSNHIFKID